MSEQPVREERLLRIISAQNEIATSDLDLPAVMELAVDRILELTGATAAILETRDGSPRRVVAGDDRAAGRPPSESSPGDADGGSSVCIPLVHRGRAIGAISVWHGEPDHFGADEIEALELLSDLIAAHLSHSMLLAEQIHDSRHDPLTELPNRRAYEERLRHELARSQRHGHPLALCLLDLDGFKAVNDDLGHPTGDLVLRIVANSIRSTRGSDEGFRVGGDEFAILMPETTAEEGVTAVERVLDDLAMAEVDALDQVGVSYGIASGEEDADSLHATADRELLAAKAALYGRDGRPSLAA